LLNPLNLKEFFAKKAVCGKGKKPSQTAFFAFGFTLFAQFATAGYVPEVNRKS
jgi:hypothetical protein